MLRVDVSVAPPGDSRLNTVADNVDRLLKQMTFVIQQRQSLCYEKEKCLKSVRLLVYFITTRQRGFNPLWTYYNRRAMDLTDHTAIR